MTNKDIIKKFKASMEEVSKALDVEPYTLKRDQYIKAAIKHKLPRLNKKQLTDLGGFSAAKNFYFPAPQPTKAELDHNAREHILESYKNYVIQHGITPTLKALKEMGITSQTITKLFGSRVDLYKKAEEEYPEIFESLVNDRLFTQEAFEKLKKNIKKKKRFFITTAVSGKEIDENFLNSIRTFEEEEDAMMIIMPCEDVASRNSIFKYELDRRLRDCNFVFENDLYINDKFFLSSISVSAKQINPLTGLQRLAQARGSMALASPKQYLEFVANSNTKIPRALMTTGAITVPDYSTDQSMSKRTSYLAEFDHKIGGIIVEIQDEKIFHFRQVQADSDGSFIDLGWKYNPDGTIKEIDKSTSVFGDTHVGSHDPDVDECLQEIVEYVNSNEIIVHDLFDCRFNNHHEMGKWATRARIALDGKSSLEREGKITAEWLNDWTNRVDKVTVVKSNHDEALEKYIDDGRWKEDPENLYLACDLVKKFIEGEDVLKYLLEEEIGLQNPKKINWLERDEDYMVYGIENGAHGDLGSNGSRGSMKSIERAYYKATVGHSHTAGILRNIYQVGTSTYRKLHYNRGPSSWTNTMCIQYPNGTRQLISVIRTKDGSVHWRLKD